MSKKILLNAYSFVFIVFLFFNLISCSTNKNIKYFQDIPDSGRLKTIQGITYTEPTIQVDDILTILVQTVDPLATTTINLGNIPLQGAGTTSSPNPGQQAAGYLVNKDGFVEMPILGRIKLLGFTTSQARDIVLQEAVKYFKDPTVIVRYANFKISVTGEVAKPGSYIVPSEKVSVIDALAMAGDLTVYGKRENVLLIRENLDGSKTPYRINLNKSNIMSSKFYYLRQNDIIYVEPSRGKAAANDAGQIRTYAILSSIVSILIVIITRIKF